MDSGMSGSKARHNTLQAYATSPGRSESCLGSLLDYKLPARPKWSTSVPNQIVQHDRRLQQSLHHLVADSPWSDQALLSRVRSRVLPAMEKHGPVAAWIVDDTAFPKKGRHSVGVARQYGGPLGKQENCRVAVSLSAATWNSSLPIAYGLYLPAAWAQDKKRRRKAGAPEEVGFQTKPQIALDQIRRAREQEVEPGVVLADAAYGNDSAFRAGSFLAALFVAPDCCNRVVAARIAHHLTVEARNRPAITALRLLAVLNVGFKYARMIQEMRRRASRALY